MNHEAIPFTPSRSPIPSWGIEEWGDEEWETARQSIQAWFDRGKVEGIRAWNAKFDRGFADAAGCFDVPGDGCWYDGMLAAHAVDERRSVALKAVASGLFGEEAAAPQKALKDWLNAENRRRQKAARDAGAEEYVRANYSDVPKEIMEPYALEDVILTRKVCDVYEPRLAEAGLQRVVDFETRTMDGLYHIERRGLPVKDGGVEYRKLEQEVIENLERLEERVRELAGQADPVVYAKELATRWGDDQMVEVSEDGKVVSYRGNAARLDDFNPRSTAQILACLKARGADLSFMSQKDGKVGADADNLRAVDDELAQAILDFRTEYKVLSTYVRPMIGRSYVSSMNTYKEPFIAPDSRIHANYRQVGARTGRMSCCIAEGSLVDGPRDLLRHPDGIPIEDMRPGDYVYSFDAGVPRPKRVLEHFDNGVRPVLKLVYRRRGRAASLGYLEATPDHRIALADGTYVRMDELRVGDRLSFLSRSTYLSTSDRCYANLSWAGLDAPVKEHRHLVHSEQIVHHRDRNPLNNSVENLVGMSISEHSRIHADALPHDVKACPFTPEELAVELEGGIRQAIERLPHDYRTLRRWADELGVEIRDRRVAHPTLPVDHDEFLDIWDTVGVRQVMERFGCGMYTAYRWRRAAEDAATVNHQVVAVLDEGRSVRTYDLTVEDTHNFVVNEIQVHNSDPNMQNQPRDDLRLRYNIVADPGHSLVTCDLSNIEMVLFAAYCGEGRLLNAIQNGDDLHELTAQMVGFRDRKRAGGGYESARQQGKVFNFCVPLSSQILTQRGWLSHDAVEVGDYTIGYNAEMRRSEWTRVNSVHRFAESELVRLSSGSWSAVCTPNHRWITEKMRRPELQGFTEAADLHSEHRIILAAPLVSSQEVALPRLSDLHRDGDWTARVLAMSSSQRRAWLAGFALGEGSRSGSTWSVFQNQGDLADAAALAMYLEGYRPTVGIQHFKGGNGPHQWSRACKPDITGQRLTKTEIAPEPVWCVGTDLRSWTMRQPGGQPMLTGNTIIYGGGLRSIRRYFRVSQDDARKYKNRYMDAYPEVRRLQNRIDYRLQDQGYIEDALISGRRFRVDPKESYKAVNYLVQGTAAALLKYAVTKLHGDGVPMVALVHDEIVAHCPTEQAPEVAEQIEKRMTEFEGLKGVVPLRADADIVQRWSDAKPLKDEKGRKYLFDPTWAKVPRRYIEEAK